MKLSPALVIIFFAYALSLSAQDNNCLDNIFNAKYQTMLASSTDYQSYLGKYRELVLKTDHCKKMTDSIRAVIENSSLSYDDKNTLSSLVSYTTNMYPDDVYKQVQKINDQKVSLLNSTIPLSNFYAIDKEYSEAVLLMKDLDPWGKKLCKFSYGNPLSYYDAGKNLVSDSAFQNEINFYHFKNGEVIADIGAGSAYFERALSKYSNDLTVYVTEIDSATVAKLITKLLLLDSTDKKSITYIPVKGTINSTGLPLNTFDKILIRNTLHHFSEPDAMLQKIKASLKTNGKLYVVDIMLNETKNTPACSQHWTREVFLTYMEKNGFVLLKETPLQYDEFIMFEFKSK